MQYSEGNTMIRTRHLGACGMAGLFLAAWVTGGLAEPATRDLPEVLAAGTLRHLVIPYASFVTGGGDGLDVEVMQRFAAHLGVKYERVETDWASTIGDLTGLAYVREGSAVRVVGEVPVRGDIIGHGMTVLPWRDELVDFSRPTFPTQIWLLVPAEHALAPIKPTGRLEDDIATVESCLLRLEVLTKPGTCLDPSLYRLGEKGARVVTFDGSLNLMAPAVLEGHSEATILDVPDALEALRCFPGRLKVIGPLSEPQHMAFAFAPRATQLRRAFDEFYAGLLADGTYLQLVRKYYPAVLHYFPTFFEEAQAAP
jgi:ABC-type amino acid transport substrate-binding protein